LRKARLSHYLPHPWAQFGHFYGLIEERRPDALRTGAKQNPSERLLSVKPVGQGVSFCTEHRKKGRPFCDLTILGRLALASVEGAYYKGTRQGHRISEAEGIAGDTVAALCAVGVDPRGQLPPEALVG
jgi:hypothetical protein